MKSFPSFSRITAPLMLGLCAAAGFSACDKQQPPSPSPAKETAAAVTPAPPPVGETGSVTPEPSVPASASSLAGYKASITDIKTFMESHQNETDSVKALDRLRELVTRITAVKTEGLPADLSTAFNTVKSAMQRIQTAFDALPVPVDQFEKWMATQKTKGEEAANLAEAKMGTFVETMTGIQKEIEPASKAMNEIGAKYGVPPLDLNGQ